MVLRVPNRLEYEILIIVPIFHDVFFVSLITIKQGSLNLSLLFFRLLIAVIHFCCTIAFMQVNEGALEIIKKFARVPVEG